MREVYLYESGDGWAVTVDGTEQRFADRRGAFAHASEQARAVTPSRVVRQAPPQPPKPVAGATAVGAASGGPDQGEPDELVDFDFDQLSTERPTGSGSDGGRASNPAASAIATDEPSSGADPGAGVVEEEDDGYWQSFEGEAASAHFDGGDQGDDGGPASGPARTRRTARGSGDAGPPRRGSAGSSARPTAVEVPRGLTGEPRSWADLAQHPALGRSLLLAAGAPVPEPWAGCQRIVLGLADLDAPTTLPQIREAYLTRTPVVYELADDLRDGPPPAALDDHALEVHAIEPSFEFVGEGAWRLLTANAVDARDPERPFWPPTELALLAGARPATDGSGGDVILPEADQVAIGDGGPFRVWDPNELTGAGPVVVVPRLALERGQLAPVTHDEPTADLAPDQLAAVREAGARARIIAPAGSGKTRVLTERVRHLARVGVPLDSLCLVAFNKRAQEEMVDRTPDLPGLQVQTLNALALAIVNGGRGFRARGQRVSTIGELDVRREIAELVKMPRRVNTDPVAAWIDALSEVRLGLRSPVDVEEGFGGDVDGFAEFFPRYRRVLRNRDLVDFDEQIYLAIEVLLTEPATRRHAELVTRLLLVDEFQDLTPAHLLLIRLLAGPDLDVFGVGDDDQTIYGYSGASPDWLIGFSELFPGAALHPLEVNYRCPAPVVEGARNLLSHNQRRVAKEIHAGPDNVTDEAALEIVAVDEPLAETVDQVRGHLAAGARPADIVVLTRVNTLLAPVQVALHLDGVAVTNRDGVRFLERTGVRAALSWLRIAARPDRLSAEDVRDAARRPNRSLSPRVIEWMGEQNDLDGLRRLAARLKDRDADKVAAFATDAERVARRAEHAPTADLLEFVRSELGLDQTMKTLDSTHLGRNSAAHTDDLRALVSLGRLHPDPATFGSFLRTALSQPDDPDGVVLSTVHRVKGLEWPHVVVHDATQGLFPHQLSTDIEEERRVFHVAITRGQRSVAVVADAAAPSLFVAELASAADPQALLEAAAAERAESAASSSARSSAKGPPAVAATIGLELEWGGYTGVVESIAGESVTLRIGQATTTVAIGSLVKVAGRRGRLAAAATVGRGGSGSGADVPSANPALFEALKQWRSGRAKADGVPAYVVAKNVTLEAIAGRAPTTLGELAAIEGIGPAKLENYGDEILAVIDESPASP